MWLIRWWLAKLISSRISRTIIKVCKYSSILCFVYVLNVKRSNHIACWVAISAHEVFAEVLSTKGRLIWIVLALVAFQIGVVYLSPKPRQIRMALHHLKHSRSASEAVIKATRSKLRGQISLSQHGDASSVYMCVFQAQLVNDRSVVHL